MSCHFECIFKIKLYIITNSTITYHENLVILCLQELHNDRVFPPVCERCHSRMNVENLKQGSIDNISISFREKKNSERQQFSQMLHFVCLLVFLNAAGYRWSEVSTPIIIYGLFVGPIMTVLFF